MIVLFDTERFLGIKAGHQTSASLNLGAGFYPEDARFRGWCLDYFMHLRNGRPVYRGSLGTRDVGLAKPCNVDDNVVVLPQALDPFLAPCRLDL